MWWWLPERWIQPLSVGDSGGSVSSSRSGEIVSDENCVCFNIYWKPLTNSVYFFGLFKGNQMGVVGC